MPLVPTPINALRQSPAQGPGPPITSGSPPVQPTPQKQEPQQVPGNTPEGESNRGPYVKDFGVDTEQMDMGERETLRSRLTGEAENLHSEKKRGGRFELSFRQIPKELMKDVRFSVGANGYTIEPGGLYQTPMYSGELLQLSDPIIKRLNSAGGLRVSDKNNIDHSDAPQLRDMIKHANSQKLKLVFNVGQESTLAMLAGMEPDALKRVQVELNTSPLWVPIAADKPYGMGAEALDLIKSVSEGNDPNANRAAAAAHKTIFGGDAKVVEDEGGSQVQRKYGFGPDEVERIEEKYNTLNFGKG